MSTIRPSPPSGSESPQRKRQRTDENPKNVSQPLRSATPPTDVVADSNAPETPQHMPPALRLLAAIKAVARLYPIGYSPTEMSKAGEAHGRNKEDVIRHVTLTPQELRREKHNNKIMGKLTEIHREHVNDIASGYLDKPFNLQITRSGCEFNGTISSLTKFKSYAHDEADFTSEEKAALDGRLKQWYEHGIVSGYGDLREQVTKVNKKVREAREIPASDFIVEPELLERIADLWDQNFFPNTRVRVEPYKIHLYAPGGHFKPHRDTPEKDLVGTFLLGLGDTSHYGGLFVNQKRMAANEGRWCAFYPDVPHSIMRLYGGHRATIAFKLFRTSTTVDTTETATSLAVRQQVSELIGQMKQPFGIMLGGRYCLGATDFTGFDALLLASAQAQLGAAVRHLPVVLKSKMTWEAESIDSYQEEEGVRAGADVYPFTPGHIEALVGNDAAQDPNTSDRDEDKVEDKVEKVEDKVEEVEDKVEKVKDKVEEEDEDEDEDSDSDKDEDFFKDGSGSVKHEIDHTSCGASWLEGVTQIPFYYMDLDRSLYLVHDNEAEACAYTGNDARPGMEDSVYLSYALLVLPTADGQPSAAAATAGSDDNAAADSDDNTSSDES